MSDLKEYVTHTSLGFGWLDSEGHKEKFCRSIIPSLLLKILPFWINRADVIHCQFRYFFTAPEFPRIPSKKNVVATFGEKWLTASHFGTFSYQKIIHKIWSFNIYTYRINLFLKPKCLMILVYFWYHKQ